MTMISEELIRDRLTKAPYLRKHQLDSKIKKIVIKKSGRGHVVALVIEDVSEDTAICNELKDMISKALIEHNDILQVEVVFSAKTEAKEQKIRIPSAGKVIVIAAGKGGVGKSTIASLLAQKLASEGKKIGIIDADIYGPSLPHIFNLSGKPELEGTKMLPLESYGIYCNSIGFLTAPDAAISWRGPMVSKALYQLLSLTKWPDLDYLLIDMPPGTGDIHLSLLQNYYIDHVIFVTLPQLLARSELLRTINLYEKFSAPIKQVIINMQQDHFDCTIASGQIKGYDAATEVRYVKELALACDSGKPLSSFASLLAEVKFN